MDVLEGPGLVAEVRGEPRAGARAGAGAEGRAEPVGLVTWLADRTTARAEIRAIAVAAAQRRRGVGTELLLGAAAALRAGGSRTAWLVTTNDNLAAQALYERLGWRLAAIRRGAIDELRRTLKPSIPEVSANGIPLRDELELELDLEPELEQEHGPPA